MQQLAALAVSGALRALRVPVTCCKNETGVVKMQHPLFRKGCLLLRIYIIIYT